MIEFLKFKTFLSPWFFIFFYYFGAIFVPFIMFLFRKKLLKKFSFFYNICHKIGEVFKEFNKKEQVAVIIFLIGVFIFFEVLWRVGFEFIIGYFEIINSLKELKK